MDDTPEIQIKNFLSKPSDNSGVLPKTKQTKNIQVLLLKVRVLFRHSLKLTVSFFRGLSRLLWKGDTRGEEVPDLGKKDTDLETEHRRCDPRGSVKEFVNNIWDANNDRKRMEKVLRKPSREEEDARISEREEQAYARNLRLTRLSKSEGWSLDIVNLLKQWEVFCYMNLRFPENRKDNVSVDEYNGFQRGALWVIEGLRKETVLAVANLKKQNANKKNANKKG